MEARHEIISFDSGSPIKFFTHKLGDVTRHWHESLELLLVLTGEVTVFTGDAQETLQQEDMLLINSNVIHELHSDDCVLIAVQIKLSKFDLPQNLAESLYFNCNSRAAADPARFSRLKRIIASTLQANSGPSESTLFRNRSLAYELLSELVQNFKAEKPTSEANTHKHLERLNHILHYINEHYQEQLTLSHLAEREHLSTPYLSSFFEKYMGINFSTYYTNLRLERAVQDLLYTDIPVEQIALKNGFSDPRAFVRAFKKRYDTVPSSYRKNATGFMTPVQKDPLLSINYLDFKPENYLHILSQYLPDTRSAALPAQRECRALPLGVLHGDAAGTPLRHSWRTFIGVGRAKELLYREVQEMLRQLQQDVGFRYLRFHGIFADDMLVCRRRQDGTLQCSFTLVDKALDFLLSIGLKPLIQFSFMPAALAADPNHAVFASPFVISPPRRMADWNHLVGSFLAHIQARYGAGEIRSWLYSVWNEPDTSIQMFGFEDVQQFYDLYENTFRTVKAFDPALTFGSPSLYPTTPREIDWMRHFLDFAREKDCAPQFMDIHYYSDNFENSDSDISTFSASHTFSSNPDHFSVCLDRLDLLRQETEIDRIPLYITEWNLTVSHRNLINDTCFKATYLVKNFLETYDRVDAIGYWGLTDFLEEYQLSHTLFHGGMGLFTQTGIRKPPYYAMQMMRQLGDTLVASGEGFFLTRQEGRFIALLYNYEHFNPLFLEEGFGLTATSRDGVFPHNRALEVTFTLDRLPARAYRLRETVLNQQHGSCFDLWADMGAPELSREEEDWLREVCRPALYVHPVPTPRGELAYRAVLAPHEVRLVELTPSEEGYRHF